jgi:short-subunit dehydrogenase|tara:strand:+ start:227 stop:1024 length:798 start_codon:yes stop_codon:yes gene_type:complete
MGLSEADNRTVVWLTGASSGIGHELCLQLIAQGHRVIASGRNQQALAKLAAHSDRVIPLAFDIADPDAVEQAGHKLAELTSHLDQVIINAGSCEYLKFPEPDWSANDRVMAINYSGAVNCIRIALPLLRKASGRGHIVGVISQVVFAPFAQAEAYGASKAALSYFLDSLRIDLAGSLDVTSVFPGFVKTPLTDRNHFSMPFIVSAEDAAKRILANIEKRPRRFVFPKRLHWLLKLSKVCPNLWQKIVAEDNKAMNKDSVAVRDKQ